MNKMEYECKCFELNYFSLINKWCCFFYFFRYTAHPFLIMGLFNKKTRPDWQETVFTNRVWLKEFNVRMKDPELLSKCKMSIDTIISALKTNNHEELTQIFSTKWRRASSLLRASTNFLKTKHDEGSIAVFAIWIFILGEKPEWDFWWALKKMTQWADTLESAVGLDWATTCFWVASMIKAMAEQYWLHWDIVRSFPMHAYFQLESWLVCDPLYWWRIWWFFADLKQYEQFVEWLTFFDKIWFNPRKEIKRVFNNKIPQLIKWSRVNLHAATDTA